MDSSTRRRHMSDVTTLTSLTSLGAPHRLGLEDGHITPAIKQELRLSIMAKRHARGEGEISADVRHPVALEVRMRLGARYLTGTLWVETMSSSGIAYHLLHFELSFELG